jgi:hypothetical protein
MPEDSDELDNDSLYVDLRDEDPDLEQEYMHSQNAHFAAAYHASRSFFGNEPSPPKNTRMTTPSECRACHEAFPSRSRLHAHLLATGHNRNTKEAPIIVESQRIAPLNPEARLSSYHFAKARFSLHSNAQAHIACLDSGYGNSAVDENYIVENIPNPQFYTLETLKEVRGIGGGIAMCTKLLMLPLFWKTIDGKYAKMTRPFHVFPDLGVDLLCGVDTLREEGIDMYYSSSLPQMRIASCGGAAVAIDVCDGEKVRKVPVRTIENTIVPANATAVVAVKIPRPLPANQDYLFTPSRLRSVATSGTGAPHAVFSHDQKSVLITNLHDTDVTLFKNTVIGHLQSTSSENVAVWHEAAKEVRGFLGLPTIAKMSTAALAFTAALATPATPATPATFDPGEQVYMCEERAGER